MLCCSAREQHPKPPTAGSSQGWQGGRGMAVVGPPLLSPHRDARIAVFLRDENISGSWRWSALIVRLGLKLTLTVCNGSPQGCTMRPSQNTFGSILPKLPGEGRSGKLSTRRQVWLLLLWSGQTRHQGDQSSTLGQILQPTGGGDAEPEPPPLREGRLDEWVAVEAKGLA